VKVAWRISNHAELNGYGGEKASGRWHTAARGKRIVYLAEHPAVALIEILVNLKGRPGLFPDVYRLLKVRIAKDVSENAVLPESLSNDWRDNIALTRDIGDTWLRKAESALLIVPSVPSPESLNYLLNPVHPDARALTIDWQRQIAYDKRLFGVRS
jgi:RES domain-containing protein